jgi:hypothetical protein
MTESFMQQRRQSGGDDSHADDRRLPVRIGHRFHSIPRTEQVQSVFLTTNVDQSAHLSQGCLSEWVPVLLGARQIAPVRSRLG